jgi:hypothetical protein
MLVRPAKVFAGATLTFKTEVVNSAPTRASGASPPAEESYSTG